VTRLPYNFSLNNELTVQVTDKRLLPREQLQFGGYDWVRGYNEWDLSGTDEGAILRTEIRAPSFTILPHLSKQISDQMQLLIFTDYGVAHAKGGELTLDDGSAHKRATLGGAGAGLRYTISPYLSLRAEWGKQLHRTGDRSSSQFHIGAVIGD
jgi:hemolysin activation/secretion protein